MYRNTRKVWEKPRKSIETALANMSSSWDAVFGSPKLPLMFWVTPKKHANAKCIFFCYVAIKKWTPLLIWACSCDQYSKHKFLSTTQETGWLFSSVNNFTLLAVKLNVLVSSGSFGIFSIVLSSNALLAPLLLKSCGGMLSSEEGSSGWNA